MSHHGEDRWILKEEQAEDVVEVERSDRIISVKLETEGVTANVLSGSDPLTDGAGFCRKTGNGCDEDLLPEEGGTQCEI